MKKIIIMAGIISGLVVTSVAQARDTSVSYTHLTLPTMDSV